ncbi:MAG: OsmC family protein [Gemmatimonadaceae bacterium]
MKITLTAEDAIRLEPTTGPMTIEAESADQLYSPFHMMASGLAFCTYSVLASWASNAKLESDDIVVDVRWTFAEDPHRIGDIALKIGWPSLPAPRRVAAERVAAMCAIHATLSHSPNIVTTVEETESAAPPATTAPLPTGA